MTLIELVIVVALVATLAKISVAAVEPVKRFTLDAAVQTTVDALRFARQQARQLHAPVVTGFNAANKTLEVYRLDFSTSPATKVTLTHPLSKQPYVVALNQASFSGTDIGIQAGFNFEDGTSASEIGFDEQGAPGKILSAQSMSPLKEVGRWRGAWQSGGVTYLREDWVLQNGIEYRALADHLSGLTFQTDLLTGRWAVRNVPAPVVLTAGGHKQDIRIAPVTGFVRY